jgi:hypothetical protein
MLVFLLVGAISYSLGIILNKFVYTQKSSVNTKQVPIILVILTALIAPSLYYGLEVIAENSAIFNQIIRVAFSAGLAMYLALFKSKSFSKKPKEMPIKNRDEDFITVTVKDKQKLGSFLLSGTAKLALINYHKEKIPSNMRFLADNEVEDLARRVLRELQDEYGAIDLKLMATNTALDDSTSNDERQVLANVLQRFIQARSNLEELTSSMGIPIDIINGNLGVAHNSTKIRVRKDSVNL